MFKSVKFSLILIVILLVLSACGTQEEPVPPADATPLDVNKFAGHYEGSWTNSKTRATGPAIFNFVVDEANKKISLTLDMGGNYLGLGDPLQQPFMPHTMITLLVSPAMIYILAKWM